MTPKTEAGWARHFAKLLNQLGHPEAAEALLSHLKGRAGKGKLPRGVYEKVPGSGDYWIRFADHQGKIRRQRVGRSLAAARDIAEQRRTEVRQGRFNPDSVGKQRRHKMTVKEMFDTYRPLRVNVRNQGEDARYAAYWSNLFGGLKLDELTREDLLTWRSQRVLEVKHATVNRSLTYLRAYYNLALADGHCQFNPVQDRKDSKGGKLLLRESASRDRILSVEEEAQLRAVVPERQFMLIEFAVQTGLRLSEQFRLRWENVDWKTRTMLIPDTKAGTPRHVPINQRAGELLQALQAEGPASPWVFCSSKDPSRPVNHKNFIRRVFKVAAKKAGLQGLNWHDLRRTTGSRLAMAGIPLNTVGEILGHSSERVTKIYARLNQVHLQEAMEALSRAQ